MALEGLHDITAITGDASRDVDLYARALGLRLVETTVNFDRPEPQRARREALLTPSADPRGGGA